MFGILIQSFAALVVVPPITHCEMAHDHSVLTRSVYIVSIPISEFRLISLKGGVLGQGSIKILQTFQ